MNEFKQGDKVTVTIEGTVTAVYGADEIAVTTDAGNTQYIIPSRATSIVTAPASFLPGKAYVDADGDVILRLEGDRSDGRVWVDSYGSLVDEDYVTPPLQLLSV